MRTYSAFIVICGFFIANLCSAQEAPKTFTGEISDSQCAYKVHSNSGGHNEMLKSGMMGNTAEACTLGCVNGMGGKYVLVTAASKERSSNIYQIEEQEKVANYAGKKVKITGTLDAKSKKLRVHSIEGTP